MKRGALVFVLLALVMMFAMPAMAVQPPDVPGAGNGNQGCSAFGLPNPEAKSPGHYFQYALDYAGWDPGGEWHGLGGWIAAWGDPSALTVGAFIQRDCRD